METNQPQGYDSAMGFLNKPGTSHSTSDPGLDATKDFGKGTMGQTNNSVLGGGSVMSKVQGTKANTMSLDKMVSQGVEFQGSFSESQVPNTGSSHGSVSTKGKVEKTTVTHSSKSLVF